ncbi:MAG: chromate transporter, partial [Atopobiaceae bacterium]|nr:chromate transporter [Atopobiaceae bacterium]
AMKIDLVEKRHWLTEEQMADVAALAQSSPGPIGVNAAMIIGFQSAGILGGLASVLGVVTPALLIMIVVSYTYQMIISNPWLAIFMQGMQIAVVALLIDVILSLFKNVTKQGVVYPLIIGVLSFIYVRFSGMTVAYLAIACAIAGVAKSFLIKDAIDNAADAKGGEQ